MDRWDRRRGHSRMLETMAAVSLGLAVAFASWSFSAGMEIAPRAGSCALAALAAFALAIVFLDRVGIDSPAARAGPLTQPETPGALLLRLQDVLAEATAADQGAGELLLNDPLPVAQPDSRVVQLFQPSTMPTAGELQARIDRHLDGRASAPEPPADHSDELFEALDTLKRSLG